MQDRLVKMLFVSAIANGLGAIAIMSLLKKLAEQEDYSKRSQNWREIMNQIIMSHYRNGGEFLIETDLEEDLEVYLLMARNGLG